MAELIQGRALHVIHSFSTEPTLRASFVLNAK